VKVVERSLQIQVQEQEIVRRDRELEATVKKPAEAEVYKLTKLAEANKNKVSRSLIKDGFKRRAELLALYVGVVCTCIIICTVLSE